MTNGWKATAALALLVSLSACGSKELTEPQAAEGAAGRGLVLRPVNVPQWDPVSAQVTTVDQAQALARIPGILTTLSVREGDYVQKGQVIGRIVDSSLAYQSGAFGAQAAAAQAQAVQAQEELDRVRFLYDNGVYAAARLEQAQAAASAAQAQVRAAQQQQRAVGAVAGQGVVLSPASGRVLAADVPAGSAVSPGMAIATITSGPVVLRLDLPESLVAQVHPGSAVLVSGLGAASEDVRGSIARVYPSVVGGRVRADATIAALDASLIGRRVSAQVETGKRRVLLVPERYVFTRYGIDYVTVHAKDDSLATIPVQSAPSTEAGMVEILSGVAAGDRLASGAEK